MTPILDEVGAHGGDLDAVARSGRVVVARDRGGAISMVRAVASGDVLAADDVTRAPAERAQAFMGRYGRLVGGREIAASELVVRGSEQDVAGATHVRLAQRFAGVPVFGGEIVVHLTDDGVRGVSGTWVEVDAAGGVTPVIDARRAMAIAGGEGAEAPSLAFYRSSGDARARLAWSVRGVDGMGKRQQAWVDARSGEVVGRWALDHEARQRVVYTPQYVPSLPNLFVVRKEGQKATGLPMVDHLYDYSGQVYDLFAGTFGRDSFDGHGAVMRTVYLVDQNCPNAYWNGSTTNYCPLFDLDDVVAHEWGHAYTELTHGLVYQGQSGALNEAYSDVWGETVDLLNGVDGAAGANNAQPGPAGVRWAIGEDFLTGHGEYELLFRDMWDPERLNYPGHVTSANYACGTDDNGGVHTNSGVPNHAYAMLVDGKTYRGVTVAGIGFVKAAHIYWHAQASYQTPTTTFAQHADALEASCADLIGAPLAGFFGQAATTITATDCTQVANAMLAVEMRASPACP